MRRQCSVLFATVMYGILNSVGVEAEEAEDQSSVPFNEEFIKSLTSKPFASKQIWLVDEVGKFSASHLLALNPAGSPFAIFGSSCSNCSPAYPTCRWSKARIKQAMMSFRRYLTSSKTSSRCFPMP